MVENGYNKDAQNMKIKFKNLKTEYHKVRKANSVSGAGRQTCKFYDLLHDLLGDRPTASMEGIDSSEINNQQCEMVDVTVSDESIDRNLSDETNFETNDFTEVTVHDIEDGMLSPWPNALSPSVASTSSSKTSSTPKRSFKNRSRTSTKTINAIQEIKESIQETLSTITNEQRNEDAFIEKLLKGQAEIPKTVTEQFTASIFALLKEKKEAKSVVIFR
ncbi:hypothetical protein ABEB36_014493 [Hypothenemus hampei]|uniref:Myb/SANT-like DNA-binding domain-containing protein n=1 Tax=Hypothenemus hampei TaxID=57062 RepID=A0ABD1E1Y6_HYPHA